MEKKELRDRLVQLCVKAYMFGSEQVIVDLPSLIDFVEQELDKAREEVFTKEELECILKWRDACDGEFNGMTLLPASGDDWGKEEDIERAENKLEEMLSKLSNK